MNRNHTVWQNAKVFATKNTTSRHPAFFWTQLLSTSWSGYKNNRGGRPICSCCTKWRYVYWWFVKQNMRTLITWNMSNFPSVIFNKIQSIRKQDENQLNTHKCVSKSEVYVFFFLAIPLKISKSPLKFNQNLNLWMNRFLNFHLKNWSIFQLKIWISDWNSKQDKIIL